VEQQSHRYAASDRSRLPKQPYRNRLLLPPRLQLQVELSTDSATGTTGHGRCHLHLPV
jgi:hypothetical protein